MSQNRFQLGQVTTKQMLGLMFLAYAFSFAVRLIWVFQFHDNPSFYWNGELMINTNDGYFFASGVQEALSGIHQSNPRVFGMWDYGVILITTLFAKILPFSIETLILYMPALISSLVVIPMILIARLYNQTLWGFFAALLGSITWSYYNRTMTGYYDTDMFSAMAPMFILYFLMKSTLDLKIRTALYAGIAIIIYPFLYDQGQAIIYAIGIIYGIYMLIFHRDNKATYQSFVLIFVSLFSLGLSKPMEYIIHIAILVGLYLFLKRDSLQKNQLVIYSAISFILFLVFGNVFSLLIGKVMGYLATGTSSAEGLKFYSVVQTVREAGKIPFEIFANRTSGSVAGVIISLIGYVVLVFRKPVFILALPLIGIGIFSLWGGLRFTVYAVPIAAMSAVYLLFVLAEKITDNKFKYAFIILSTFAMIYPNLIHIIGYKVPTVFNKAEVNSLVELDKVASAKDYTITWWDYGYPIWYYSDTSTLIDGGKHNQDNFIVSKILTTDSAVQAANLARLSVETYVDSNYSIVAPIIFKNKNPNQYLQDMKSDSFKLPPKTRDIYIYLPQRMLNIFPTVAVFSNLDLVTGKEYARAFFYTTSRFADQGQILNLGNGIRLNKQNSVLYLGQQKTVLKRFVDVSYGRDGKLVKKVQNVSPQGTLSLIYMRSYNQFLLLDEKMYNSLYIKLFVLQEYDPKLFTLVVNNPYAKVYKINK